MDGMSSCLGGTGCWVAVNWSTVGFPGLGDPRELMGQTRAMTFGTKSVLSSKGSMCVVERLWSRSVLVESVVGRNARDVVK